MCHPVREQRQRRYDLLSRSLELAAELEAEGVNLATGPQLPEQDPLEAWRLLEDTMARLLDRAQQLGQRVSLEPEPGHLVHCLAEYGRLAKAFPALRLGLDVGHVSVTVEEGTAAQAVTDHGSQLGVVHLEDAPLGRHEHLPLGQGELDLAGIVSALEAAEFPGLVTVELSRHSHAAHELVPETLAFLRGLTTG